MSKKVAVVQDHARCTTCTDITAFVTSKKAVQFADGNCICEDCVKWLISPDVIDALNQLADNEVH